MTRIFAVSGSLRRVSSNSSLLRGYADLCPSGSTIDVYERLAELPHFNPDIEGDGDPVVLDLIARVRDADAFVVTTPEYAHGLPGSLKNGLDWLVGSDAFINKPYALLIASPRSVHAPAQLREILNTMSGVHVGDADVTVDLKRNPSGAEHTLADAEVRARLERGLSVLIEFCNSRSH